MVAIMKSADGKVEIIQMSKAWTIEIQNLLGYGKAAAKLARWEELNQEHSGTIEILEMIGIDVHEVDRKLDLNAISEREELIKAKPYCTSFFLHDRTQPYSAEDCKNMLKMVDNLKMLDVFTTMEIGLQYCVERNMGAILV